MANSKLIQKLDRVFSEYIRLRDSNTSGLCQCISCGKLQHWKEVDCGHYVNRQHMATRFNEKNCNAQCRKCNRFDEGNSSGYTLGLVQKYGFKVIEELNLLRTHTSKLTDFEIKAMADLYKDEVKKLKKIKSA